MGLVTCCGHTCSMVLYHLPEAKPVFYLADIRRITTAYPLDVRRMTTHFHDDAPIRALD